ncbi:response regulator transcription factor [Streptomyces sp. NPDC090306]|uniref:helix-turn-helix transcriptional regulator n=1 Tax=Streptomyces sp. NPDC090306 TaxID=3365961 RepID=UPI0038254684
MTKDQDSGGRRAAPLPISPGHLARIRQDVMVNPRSVAAQLIAAIDQLQADNARLATENMHLRRDAAQHPICPLTPRQLAVLTGAANGESRIETARRLAVAEQTVASFRKIIVARVGARNLTQAVAFALTREWIPAAAIVVEGFSPVALGGDRPPRSGWAGVAQRVRGAWGGWVVLERKPINHRRVLTNTAYRIRKARISHFGPAGSFDTRVDNDGPNAVLLARYAALSSEITERASA